MLRVPTYAILTAAGSGSRLGSELPKALVPLAGEPIVVHAARRLLAAASVDRLVVTAPPAHLDAVRASLTRAGLPATVVAGGASRQESVRLGLAAVPETADVVLVHDAARALAPPELADRVDAAVRSGHVGVIPALPVADTIKRVVPDGGSGPRRVTDTVPRADLRIVQTPQGFDAHVLRAAHAAHRERGLDESTAVTDDAGLLEAEGAQVWSVAGDELAMKITTRHDLERAELLLTPQDRRAALPRTGTGLDVHAFAPEGEARELWLAGLLWPDERGLAGHSDADVVAHAAADALFSACGLGDLGSNFGTSEPQWAGAAGAVLLAEAARRVRAAGYEIGNVAVQVVGNRPRLGPRRAEAEAAMSAAAGAPVTVSATTSDHLGFTGRGEGVAAIATALVVPVTGAGGRER